MSVERKLLSLLVITCCAVVQAASIDDAVERTRGRAWITYGVQAHDEAGRCCGEWEEGVQVRTCRLHFPGEGQSRWNGHQITTHGEGDGTSDASRRELVVYLGVEDGELLTVQAYSASCRPRLGDDPIEVLEGLTTDASARWLSERVEEARRRDLRDEALMAMAAHAGTVADRSLARWATQRDNKKLAEQAIFWVGASQRPGAYELLTGIVDSDRSTDLREHAIFAIGQLEDDEALAGLIEIARNNETRSLRSNALFWLSQRAGEHATATIERAVTDDPDSEVREQAVFALSQLPRDEAVPLLMKLVREHGDPGVREKAAFWLGQMESPEVVDFFEEILRGDG